MSAATSNLHDQFHAMLQNMKQTVPPAPSAPLVPSSPLPPLGNSSGLAGGAAGGSVVSVTQKDNIGAFFKKHWGKILALCIIVVVVTVFVARYFISKRKKTRKLKEAHQDQENIQWEQYFAGDAPAAGGGSNGSPVPQIAASSAPAVSASNAPAVSAGNFGGQGRPSQRGGVPPQIQQIQAQLNAGAGVGGSPFQQPPRPQQDVPPLSRVSVQQQAPPQQQVQQQPPPQQQQPKVQPQPPPAPAPVDPRLAAAGVSIPQRQPKEKEADLPKADTDQRGRAVEPSQPVGKVVDDIVVA